MSIVGMLLLTCVLILVQGSKVELGEYADWATVLSAVATAGVFVVTLLAFKAVPDWLAPKLKDRQFAFADELIEGFCTLQQEALHLFDNSSRFLNSPPIQDVNLSNQLIRLDTQIEKYIKNIILLSAKMERMILWGLKPKNSQDFQNLIKYHERMYAGFIASRDLKISHASKQIDGLLETNTNMQTIYRNLVEAHKVIIKPYDELFEK